MFRAKKCAQLEIRLARARQMMSNTEDENQQIRAKVDELRRLITMQKEVYATCQARMRRCQAEQVRAKPLRHNPDCSPTSNIEPSLTLSLTGPVKFNRS